MRRSTLGTLQVSIIGLGCNNFGRALDAEESRAVVDTAVDLGVDFFDTSDNYGEGRSERYLAEALGSRRNEVVIATKFGMPVAGEEGSGGARPEYIRRAVRRSLTQLGRDWIDLYQLHKPDPWTPIGDTLETLWELVDDGLVREIGCSNLDAAQLTDALDHTRAAGNPRIISNQVEYSLLHRDPQGNGLRDVALSDHVALLPFYPLGSGMLTGKVVRGRPSEGRLGTDRYRGFLSDRHFDVVERLEPFASERGLSMVQVALGWLLAQPEVPAVTPGATKPEQVRSNIAAAHWQPTRQELAMLDGYGAA